MHKKWRLQNLGHKWGTKERVDGTSNSNEKHVELEFFLEDDVFHCFLCVGI